MSTIQTSYYRNKLRFDFSREQIDFILCLLDQVNFESPKIKEDEFMKRQVEFLKFTKAKMQKFLNDTEESKCHIQE